MLQESSHIHHDTITGRGASKKSREDTVAEDMEMGGYSILSYGEVVADSGSQVGEEKGKAVEGDEKPMKEGNNKKYENKNERQHAAPDTTVDQLYAQVDKKKKKDGDTTHPHPPEADTPVDQLYAQVDKKKEGGDTTHPHPPEVDTPCPVDQLYAQVDKKKKSKGKEVSEDFPQELGAVYSVVSKPHPPQVPAKTDLLIDDLYN